jgi:hypothetical protein
MLSQALLEVLPEGVQVNLRLIWNCPSMGWSSPYIPLDQALFLFLGNRFIAFLWKINMSQGLIQGCLH